MTGQRQRIHACKALIQKGLVSAEGIESALKRKFNNMQVSG